MKTLLAVGCSLTNNNFTSKPHPEMDCSWPKWPEVVGKKLGYNVVNLGKSGNSNDAIFKSAQDYIIDHKVDMICALWTQATRLNIHDMFNINWIHSFKRTRSHELARTITDRTKLNVLNSKHFSQLLSWKHTALANEHLRNIYMLDQLGKYNNVPTYHAQGVRVYFPYWQEKPQKPGGDERPKNDGWTSLYKLLSTEQLKSSYTNQQADKVQKDFLKAMLDSQYFSILDKQNNIWDWPFFPELKLNSKDKSYEDVIGDAARISKKDTHPNAEGQQILASMFMGMI